MKERRILSAIGLADERYLEEASPARMKWIKTVKQMGALAASVCVLLTFWLGYRIMQQNPDPAPPQKPSFERYSTNPYYSVIEKLGMYQYQLELDAFYNKDTDTDTDKDDNNPDCMLPSNEPHYVKTPTAPTEGITTGYLIQQSQDYVYYLAVQENAVGAVLYAYPYKKWSSDAYDHDEWKCEGISSDTYSYDAVGSYRIRGDLSIEYSRYVNEEEWDMYLSEDGCTLTVFSDIYHHAQKCHCTRVLSFDVSDPHKIKLKKELVIKGSFVSCVKADGRFLVVTETGASQNYDDKYSFLPWLWNGDKKVTPDPRNIIMPKELAGTQYTSVWMLDETSLDLNDSYAFLSNYQSEDIYISKYRICIPRPYEVEAKGFAKGKEMTEITILSHTAKGMKKAGTISLEGRVENSHSMNQYSDMLRVVTSFETENGSCTANFYCITIPERKIRSKKLRFAPNGQSVQSVRFEGERVYVSLADEPTLNDPVYVFDLSDPDTVRYQSLGAVGKYSDRLFELEGEYLLSIWEDENNRAKVNIYRQEGQKTVSVCQKTLEGGLAISHNRDVLFDRELGVFGFAYYNGKLDVSYILFHFEDGVLEEWLNIPAEEVDQYTTIFARHFALVGNRVCVFTEEEYTVYPFRYEKVQ